MLDRCEDSLTHWHPARRAIHSQSKTHTHFFSLQIHQSTMTIMTTTKRISLGRLKCVTNMFHRVSSEYVTSSRYFMANGQNWLARKICGSWFCQVNCADDNCSGFTQPFISVFLVPQSFLMTLTMSWAKSPKNLSRSEGVTHRWTPAWLLPTRTSYKSTLAPIYLFHCYSSFSSSPHFPRSFWHQRIYVLVPKILPSGWGANVCFCGGRCGRSGRIEYSCSWICIVCIT